MRRGRDADSPATGRVKIPWFILFFAIAAAFDTYLPRLAPAYLALNHLGKVGLTATLFLIGTSLSKRSLQAVGVRPLLQGIILWVIVASISLGAICRGWITI